MTGMGFKKDPRAPKFSRPKKRAMINPVSENQQARTDELKAKLLILLAKQHELYGTTRCEAGFKGEPGECYGDLVWDHVIPRSRFPENVDGYSNAQVLCWFHNGKKGSRVTDYRPPEIIRACEVLDNSCDSCGVDLSEGDHTDEGEKP